MKRISELFGDDYYIAFTGISEARLHVKIVPEGGIMDIQFTNPGADYMIRQIMLPLSEGETAFWTEPLYHFYPELDRDYAKSLPFPEKKSYIEHTLRAAYLKLADTIDAKAALYAAYWAECRAQVTDALSEAFQVDCAGIFHDLRCNLSMSPIAPRYLQEKYFDVFYLNSEKGAIGSSIHEIIHFVWFYVWNQVFGDSYEEYERPSLKWILSEMVVESIMRDPRLCSINPYFPREEGGCIYPYFFDLEGGGELALTVLDQMYREQPIEEFMKNSYAYCQKHETEIRRHIQEAEGGNMA